ncbi:cytosine permease [Amycolatopsis acidiphila]|uniref:Cytosine permease n=1 Tax=Amycolatopsis acidiphila TaxID=715473 RepID=A0A558AJ59_9PSEU|nr:cytosine permease [Amycolatopsis acidiphila]TVT24297.1 cytosine permease [Amycolatopsis acidiphila]UIJ62570.1 cytosine permease [Amycolatopsis acidiphila]GHG85485.1 cytosine permease [Amycolatopsis acidiphila]
MSSSDTAFVVERRSIDIVPDSERHGRPFNQFTLWLGANLQITGIVTGALAVIFGADAFWSIIGLLVGNLLGGIVMALHSVQGPRLGLPQMISSRAQFGVYGAVVPLCCVVLMYCGFVASSSVLAGQAVAALTHIDVTAGIIIFSAITGVIAVVGYRMIHALGRIASAISVLAFLYLAFRLLQESDLGTIIGERHTSVPEFLLAMSLSAGYQLAYGPYVADYSRYLPRSVSRKATFWSTYAGSVLGCQWSMAFGALAAAAGGSAFTANQVSYVVGLGAAGLVAAVLYFVIALGKLTINVLNTYGGFMSLVTMISGFRGQYRISRRARTVYIVAIIVVGTTMAVLGRTNFLPNFSTFLFFLLTFFTPWSAVNLVDYYCIAKERYDTPALTDPDGRYGRWRWRALLSYGLGVLAQLPFLATSLYTGPLVGRLGGADISWIVGLAFTGLLYYFLARSDRNTVPEALILPDEVFDTGAPGDAIPRTAVNPAAGVAATAGEKELR